MSALGEFQDAFTRALTGAGTESDALARQPGFSVYRNTVIKGCTDALLANFPAVARLVGEPWFRDAAAAYARHSLPRDARLLFYGEGFPDFLAQFPPAAALPYLPGVALLDRYWIECHAAANEEAQSASALMRLPAGALGTTVIPPRASTRWRWFDDMPVYAIWSANRAGRAVDDLAWQGGGALIVRESDVVRWTGIGRAHCAFLDACAAGRTLAEAAQAAFAAAPDADIPALTAALLGAGALRAVSAPATSP